MSPLNNDLLLVWPIATEITRTPCPNSPRVAEDGELRQCARLELIRITLHDSVNVRRLSFDRDLARPHEHRKARAAFQVRGSIARHFVVAEWPRHTEG